jgi:hypothetical protein
MDKAVQSTYGHMIMPTQYNHGMQSNKWQKMYLTLKHYNQVTFTIKTVNNVLFNKLHRNILKLIR